MFTGREKELQYLETYNRKKGIRFVVVYGQKGIGKTTLLRQFTQEKEFFYYEALSCCAKQQKMFMSDRMKECGIPVAKTNEFRDLVSLVQETKDIFIIDEFHNMCKTDGDFFETLYRFINEEERKKSLYIILCSSLVSWVENSMVTKMGALSHKLNGLCKVKELKYQDFKEFFPRFSVVDRIGAFSILGGIPGLWQYFNDTLSLRENIENFILNSNCRLFDYGQQYVAEELRETAVYNTLLTALAAGNRKLNDLHLYTGFSRAKISVYLKNLMELELVEKVFSIDTDGRENAQKGLYQIKHPYVSFYYRYLFSNLSKLNVWKTDEFYERLIEPTLKEFISPCFKRICREFLEKESALGRLPGAFLNKGQWIGKKGNIDFIFQDEDEEILTGICNWEKDVLMEEDYRLFVECQKNAKIDADYVILFSAGTFDNRLRSEAKKNPRFALVSVEQMQL